MNYLFLPSHLVLRMELILDGISEIGAHGRRNLCYLIRLKVITNWIFFLQKVIFIFMRAQHFLSYHLKNISTMESYYMFYSTVWSSFIQQ